MIDFIFGDAGSGKSTYIYTWLTSEAEHDPDGRYYLFVPEQNTLNAQREIIARSSRHGMLNLDVLSFQLLAYRVMGELGIETPVVIDDVGRSILIRKAAMENADSLRVYKNKLSSNGFIHQMKNIISEFYQYDISPEQLEEAQNKESQPLLKGKLSDIAAIYRSFREMLSERAAIPEEIIYILLSCIERSELLKDAVIVFDGYTGFTPIQERVLEHIIPQARRCRFAVTIPMSASPYRRLAGTGSDSLDQTDIFMLSRDTVYRVCRAAEKNNIVNAGELEIRRTKHSGGGSAASSERPDRGSAASSERPDRGASASSERPGGGASASSEHLDTASGISSGTKLYLISSRDPVDEVRLAARRVRRLALSDGARYSRIAVVVSDPATYKELIINEFGREELPYFIDDRNDAIGSPAVQYLRSALRVICRGYQAEDIVALLRNPLISADEDAMDEADLADNYLRKTGRRGKQVFCELGLKLIDPAAIIKLDSALKEAECISGMTKAIADFMSEEKISDKAKAYSARLNAAGFAREAGECGRFAESIQELLDRMDVILGSERSTVRDFAGLLDAGFSEMRGGSIPETMDMVMIGDLKRSRLDNIDYLLVLGANDGLIPSAVTGGGIFTDRERLLLKAADIELAPDDMSDTIIQKFYLRLLLNKPRKELYISYPAAGRDGKTLKPSPVLREIEEGSGGADFDSIVSTKELSADIISSRQDALMYMAERVQSASDEDDEFLDTFKTLSLAGEDKRLDKLMQAAFTEHKPDRLSIEAAKKLYGELLTGSVTRIEDYEGCPFYHFAKHGLKLRERDKAAIERVDIGNLFHGTLDLVFKTIEEDGKDICDMPLAELEEICAGSADKTISEYNDNVLDTSARNRYIADKVKSIALRTVKTLRTQLKDGDFKTAGTEVRFSFREDNVVLHGSIDRVDTCHADGKTYVKVIDYKSGNRSFSVARLASGLELQLAAYLGYAVKLAGEREGSRENIVPAGMFYYHIDDPNITYERGMDTESIEEEKLKKLLMKGAVSSELKTAAHIDNSMIAVSAKAADSEGMEAGTAQLDKKALKNSSVIDRSSELLSPSELKGFMSYAARKIKDDSAEILSGCIDIKPFREGGRTKCDYCGFGGICGFDTGIDGFAYRNIRKTEKDKLKALLAGEND